MKDGTLKIHGDAVALFMGNMEIKKSPNFLHAVPYRAVIRTCSRLYTDTDIYVAGAMHRPDDEENITQHVKHVNECMKKICKELQKFEHISVTYIGVCHIFLENSVIMMKLAMG